MNNPQAQANRMHVRRLLQERQPGFAAALKSVEREFALEHGESAERSPAAARPRTGPAGPPP